jgi:hypothetical protein
MIVITRSVRGTTPVLKVDGRLFAEDIDVLAEVCGAEAACPELDLSDLRYADRRGVDTLRQLRARGVRLTSLSPYLGLILGCSAS